MRKIGAADPLGIWLSESLDDPGPFALAPLQGGHSNETLMLLSEQGKRVMRRPPAAAIDPRAHSMEREHRILDALRSTDAPTPQPLAYCTDHRIAPGGLLVMEHVEGVALTAALPPGYPDGAAGARATGRAVIDALAALHAVPWREVGLEGFGSPDGFLERQVNRWRSQYESYAVRALELFDPIAEWLERNRPRAFTTGIMHGDFRIDNCLLSREPPVRVEAIIDFEMCTVGDPLIDLGLMLALWGPERPSNPALPGVQGFSRVPGAPSREELAGRYSAASGRSVEHLDYYIAIALWKLAAILEGAYAHHVRGNLNDDYAHALEHDVPALLEEAAGVAGIA